MSGRNNHGRNPNLGPERKHLLRAIQNSSGVSQMPVRNQTLGVTNQTRTVMDEAQIGEVGESPPPIHPISIPEQDEITQPLHFFRCRRYPKKEGTLFINKTYRKTTGEEGSGRLPFSIITRKGCYPFVHPS